MDLMELLQSVVNGVLLGTLYGLFGLGLAFGFGIMRIVNVAQGEFIAAPMPLKGLPTALNFWRGSYRALAAPDIFDF